MPNHKDVLGNEIHPTRVDLITQGRSPRFAGEVVFDVPAETLIVATSLAPDSWRRGVPAPPPIPTPPIAFHWSLNLAITNSLAFNRLSLFYAPPNANVNASSSFSLLRRFVAGVDIARGTVLDLTPWIAAKGTGFYMPLLIVPDAYGGNDAGLAPQVRLTWSNPPSASGIKTAPPASPASPPLLMIKVAAIRAAMRCDVSILSRTLMRRFSNEEGILSCCLSRFFAGNAGDRVDSAKLW
jgi:hypothetical protein